MDDSKERRKSVKSRRRSLRNLQPTDVGALAVDQNESLCDATLGGQLMYGSVWIEHAESPAPVRKPRRSVSCSQISQDLANSVVRNKRNVYGNNYVGKENLSPNTSPLKMVEDTPKRMPVLCPAKSADSPIGNCSIEDVWNNSYAEIGVPRFGHKAQDGSLSEESLVGTISILSIDEMDIQCQDQKVNCSVENELQISSDSFSEMNQDKIDMESEPLCPDQVTAESLTETHASFNEEIAKPSLDSFFDSVSSSGSPHGVVYELTTPDSTGETQIYTDNSHVLSGEENSEIPNKDSSCSSSNLCQDFQQLDISNVSTGSNLDTTAANEESDLETLHESTLDPLHASNETFSTSLLDSSSLDQCCSQSSDSWCFVKCYPDEKLSDVSALIDSSVSDGCEVWETDLSSAGSELSDSWCFNRCLNTADHFNSTPCKTTSPMTHKINNDQCVESAKHLIFTTEDESIKEHETNVPVDISSVCIAIESSAVPLDEKVQKLPAIGNLSLEDSYDLNEEHLIRMQEKFQVKGSELCLGSNDKLKKDESEKKLPKKTLNKKTTQQNSNSKIQNVKPSLKSDFQLIRRKPIAKSEKSSPSQPLASTTRNSKSSTDLTRKSTQTKKQTTMNTKMSLHDKVKSPTDLKKSLGGKRKPLLGTQLPSEKSLKLEENSHKTTTAGSKQNFQPKTISPNIVIVDSLKTTPEINTIEPRKEKVKTLAHVSKSTKSLSTDKRKALKGSNKSVPVEMPPWESNQSFDKTGQQMDSKQALVSNEKTKNKLDSNETLSATTMKKKQVKGSNGSSFNQVSSVSTLAAKTKGRSLDSLATSTVTIRRLNTQTRSKSTDTTCKAETSADLVLKKEITKPTSSKREKLRRRALVVPALDMDDVMVVDLPPLTSSSSNSDSTFSENIPNKQVTTRTKRRCQSIGSAYFSIEETIVNDDLATLPSKDTAVSLVNHSTTDRDDKPITANNQCSSVGSASIFTGVSLEMVDESPDSVPCLVNNTNAENSSKMTRGKRKSRSMGLVSAKEHEDTSIGKAQSGSSKPVKISDDVALAGHSQNQTTLRRSTRRSSIELSLSLNSNSKQTSTAAQGNNNNGLTVAQSANSLEINDDDDEQLREIYAKKPYVPISPSRLETIYSPTKKRGENTVFGKRKVSRTLSFQPSETQLKKRRNKALRNWPFLFEVIDIDEKLDKLLNTV